MGKKKDKKKTGAGAAKTAEKTKKKDARRLKAAGEDEIEAILAELNSASDVPVAETRILPMETPPLPRSNATLSVLPGRPELFLYGGEFFDGRTTKVFNDSILCAPWKNEFRLLKCPENPPHRSAHQAISLDRNGGEIFIFGGEFQSPSGSQFHHFKDLWVFSTQTLAWTQIKAKGAPSARSGHRMVHYKGRLWVFGGFSDSGQEIVYHQDMKYFDLADQQWKAVEKKGSWPEARSGFCWVVDENSGLGYLYGGVGQRVKEIPQAAATAGKTGKKAATSMALPETITHSDFWSFNFQTLQWSLVKKKGAWPAPRVGLAATNFPVKNRAFFFGGASDAPLSEKNKEISSSFPIHSDSSNYNDFYSFSYDNQSFQYQPVEGKIISQVEMVAQGKKSGKSEGKQEDSGKDVEMQDGNGNSSIFDFNPVQEALPVAEGNSGAAEKKNSSEDSSQTCPPAPLPRRSAHLVQQNGRIFLYGGIFEGSSEKDYTLSDWWEYEPAKREWKSLIEIRKEDFLWYGSDDEKSDEEGESADEESGDSEDDEDDDEDEGDEDENSLDPLADEELNEFFGRTRTHWLEVGRAAWAAAGGGGVEEKKGNHDKEIRKFAFEAASKKFQQAREEE